MSFLDNKFTFLTRAGANKVCSRGQYGGLTHERKPPTYFIVLSVSLHHYRSYPFCKPLGRLHQAATLLVVGGTRDARLFYHGGGIASSSAQDEEAKRLVRKAHGHSAHAIASRRQQLAKEFAMLQSQISLSHRVNQNS